MLKILGGEFRSRRLIEPRSGEASRPYLARIKESVFNLLRGWFEEASVFDLFAGVGTVGLEAVSRGATHVVMVERDRETFGHLQGNIDALGCGDRATAVMGDALSEHVPGLAHAPVDLLFVDPPYPMMIDDASRQQVLDQIHRCRSVLAQPSFVILRSPLGPDQISLQIEGFAGPEPHDYGRDKWVLLYQPNPRDDTADESDGT